MSDLPRRLAGATLTLVAPTSQAERWDVLMAVRDATVDRPGGPTHRVLAGALGLCWPRLRDRIPYRGDLVEYGGKVIDLLLDPKLALAPGDKAPTLADIIGPGWAAVDLCRDVVSQQELEHAEGFSAAPGASSTASGTRSSGSGGSSPGGSAH